MLVLTRRPGESIMLGDEVQVEVTEISGNQVKLGFSAPPAVRILRAEVWRRRERSSGRQRLEPRLAEERRRRSA